MAHAVLSHLSHTKEQPLNLDSAGTGAYHAGAAPDHRTILTLKKHGITNYKHAARKIRPADFAEFDYVLGMDDHNLEDLKDAQKKAVSDGVVGANRAKVSLFGDVKFGGKGKGEEIDDPYYGGRDGFQTAYEQVNRFAEGFLQSLKKTDS